MPDPSILLSPSAGGDLVAMDTTRAVELQRRMDHAAYELDWDAQALAEPLHQAEMLLGGRVPDVAGGTRRVANELRDTAADLHERTRIVLAGGPEMNEGLAALERVRQNFTMIESRGEPDRADGILSRRDLQWARHSADEQTAAAAGWLLDHDHFFDQVETANHNNDYLANPYEGEFAFDADDRDGKMSLDDIDAFLDKTTAWSALLPHLTTIDAVADGRIDGFMSKQDFEIFLREYNPPPEVAAAVGQVLEDGAYHRNSRSIGFGTALDAISFVPVVGDLVDGARAVYYALHGDYATASLFALGLVPLPGLSASGVRGAVRVVKEVGDIGRKKGAKPAFRAAVHVGSKGTAANYAAYESARRAGNAFGQQVDVDESVDYALNDVLGPRIEGSLGTKLDPRIRRMISNQLEDSLEQRLNSGSANWVNEANQVIARRIAEHHAHESVFRKLRIK